MGLIDSSIFLISVLAGLLGALTGLGGGVVIVPALALLFHIDIRYAIGASLISVIATSSGTAVSYVREGFSNVRIGMFLEVATTLGAIGGAYLDRAHLHPCHWHHFWHYLALLGLERISPPAGSDPAPAK